MTDAVGAVLEGYLDLRWRLNPVEATYVGRHDLDHLLGDFRRERIREFSAALKSYTLSLESVEADSLEDEIDRTAALHSARHDLLVLERERPFARDPSFHVSHALGGLFLLLVREPVDAAHRARALVARLEAIPEFFANAREVLTDPVNVFVQVAREMIPGSVALVRDGLDDPDLDLSAADAEALRLARERAVTALLEMSDALAEMEEQASADVAIGRDLFDRKLHTAHMIQENADELLRYGERLVAEAKGELARVAEEMRPGASWRELVEELRRDVPAATSVIAEYESVMGAARDFTRERGIMPVPEAPLDIRPTPDFLRALVPFAAYQGPPALAEDQRGLFFVTLPVDGEPWRATCRAELASTALHEAYPGHHLQIATANRLPRIVRRVLSTPAAQEGWALYCESLMVETGFLSTPAQRLFQAHHLLWRALRIVLDVSLHTRGMTVETAARMLREELGFDERSAESEARRYGAYPTYQLCYAVGRRDILQLREDARAARGAAFSLESFHRELLSYGALPIPLARWGMGLA